MFEGVDRALAWANVTAEPYGEFIAKDSWVLAGWKSNLSGQFKVWLCGKLASVVIVGHGNVGGESHQAQRLDEGA